MCLRVYQSPVGSVDGSFGSGVTSAVRTFQTKFGMTSDGVVGSGTWNRMSQNVITEATDYIFYLHTPFSSTYWVYYMHLGGSTSFLIYDLMYKSNNTTVSTGRVIKRRDYWSIG
ncbi:peptidoglycan-binding domain-containing protein [Paenibacillus lautus]|uniref:peptidoglycan-binding domain-containing protein n=1 Tax=Paenibacillus lautus TaxID=1401 RepID=UPI000FD8F5E7|nr:peptidoglycan-binding domain-containing protein [Paenibacillus lautus]